MQVFWEICDKIVLSLKMEQGNSTRVQFLPPIYNKYHYGQEKVQTYISNESNETRIFVQKSDTNIKSFHSS